MSEHQHSWRFWGDDPYVICECGEVRDAISGRVAALLDIAATSEALGLYQNEDESPLRRSDPEPQP